MNAKTTPACPIKCIIWDNESVLAAPDWNVCYDVAYQTLGQHPPLAGTPTRGKLYKKMLSVPITPALTEALKTFVPGDEESNFLQAYSSGHISGEEFWPIACEHGFNLVPSQGNIAAIRTAQTYLLRDHNGDVRVLPEVVSILEALAETMPQFMLSNTNPEIYAGFAEAGYMASIPEQNRLFQFFCTAESLQTKYTNGPSQTRAIRRRPPSSSTTKRATSKAPEEMG